MTAADRRPQITGVTEGAQNANALLLLLEGTAAQVKIRGWTEIRTSSAGTETKDMTMDETETEADGYRLHKRTGSVCGEVAGLHTQTSGFQKWCDVEGCDLSDII